MGGGEYLKVNIIWKFGKDYFRLSSNKWTRQKIQFEKTKCQTHLPTKQCEICKSKLTLKNKEIIEILKVKIMFCSMFSDSFWIFHVVV